jgi:signal peptidase I
MAAGAQATTGTLPFPGVLRHNAAWHALRWIGTVLLAVVLVRTFIGEASVVPTGSMQGTILVGDHIFLDKLLYGPRIPFSPWHLPVMARVRRGDIVAFRYPRDPEITFLKRVVAVAGDRIEIRDDALFVNGNRMNEPYVVHNRRVGKIVGYHESMSPLTVPEGHMFVMGDNRDDSEDSRYFGAVPLANIVGEPVVIYWSYDAPSSQWLEDDPVRRLEFYGSIVPHLLSRTRWHRVGELL